MSCKYKVFYHDLKIRYESCIEVIDGDTRNMMNAKRKKITLKE